MSKYIGKYTDEGALIDALLSGELSKPYVALVGNSLNYNEFSDEAVFSYEGASSATVNGLVTSIVLDIYASNWTISTNAEWVTLDTVSGSGVGNCTVSFSSNFESIRNAIITASFGDTSIDFSLTQTASSYLQAPLTLEFLSSGNVSFNGFQEKASNIFDVECNINGGGWNSTSLYSSEGIDVVSGDTIQLRGGSINNKGYDTLSMTETPYIVSTADFNAFGNVYSMISPENFAQVTNPSARICQIFGYCSTLKSAENLYMGESGTTMVSSAATGQFTSFFLNSGIEKAPALPMVTPKPYCYANMFKGCTALTDSPVIHLDNLITYNSKSLNSMFSGCTSLSAVTCLATTVPTTEGSSAKNGCYNWLKDVAANGTFTKATDVDWLTGSPHGIPSGWNVVEV